MGKPRDGKEVRKHISFRIEPKVLEEIIKEYGSFSAFVNKQLLDEGFIKEKKGG